MITVLTEESDAMPVTHGVAGSSPVPTARKTPAPQRVGDVSKEGESSSKRVKVVKPRRPKCRPMYAIRIS